VDPAPPSRIPRLRILPRRLHGAAAQTLRTIAADPKHLGAEIGFFAVLHTWGSKLLHRPHLHCAVPGGGLSLDGACWISLNPLFTIEIRFPKLDIASGYMENADGD
jgi:hypothetical protein